MRAAAWIAAGGILLWTLLFLNQLWFEGIDPEVFWKITVTLAVVVVASGAVALILAEYGKEQKLKKEGFLD